jgi:GntR family transcriptional regulator
MPRAKHARDNLFNPFPKYLQVRRALERRMRDGFQDGQQLPTEQALQLEFRVSRDTIRQALAGLESDGLLLRQAGRGTFFVRPEQGLPRQKLTGLAEDFSALHLDTVAELIEAAPTHNHDEEARAMGMQGQPLFRIVRLRRFEGQPLGVHEAYVSVPLGRRLVARDLSHGSIVQALSGRLKLHCEEALQRIEAVAADLPWARMLEVRMGEPLLLVTRLMRVKPDAGSVLFRSWYRADRYCYTIDLSA